MCSYLSCHISFHTAPFCVHDISKCSSWDALNFVPLCHARLSSYWCPNLWCKSAIWCLLLLLIRTWWFIIFVAFDVCILWAWALHVFWCMSCHLYIGLCLLLFYCYVSMWLQRDPCSFWRCSIRIFCRYGYSWSIHAFVLLYFCYKIFLADC